MPAMEAECIYVVEEILEAFPLGGKPAHLVNHSKILDAIIDIFPAKQREAVCEILVQHGRLQRTWSKTSSDLFKLIGVSRSMCDLLGALNSVGACAPSFEPSRGTVPDALSLARAGDLGKMRSLVLATVPRLKHVVQEGFDELRDILSLCQQMGVKNVKVAPLLATNHDLHRNGTIFESHMVRGKTRDIVAAGGRCVAPSPRSSPRPRSSAHSLALPAGSTTSCLASPRPRSGSRVGARTSSASRSPSPSFRSPPPTPTRPRASTP